MKTRDIRHELMDLYDNKDIADNGTIEILNASFIADEESIFGRVNYEYAEAEIKWYNSKSLNINDIPYNPIPKIWKNIATKDGLINSNYGWCIYSLENGDQFVNCMITLARDKSSRQATMIYNRPSMHEDACKNGMQDFMCTNSVQLFIRKNTLHYHVYMRSNDAVFGYKNDRYWHNHVFKKAFADLRNHYPHLLRGNLYWNVASLHVYPQHFKLIRESI